MAEYSVSAETSFCSFGRTLFQVKQAGFVSLLDLDIKNFEQHGSKLDDFLPKQRFLKFLFFRETVLYEKQTKVVQKLREFDLPMKSKCRIVD